MCGCLACDLGNSFTAAAPGLLLLLPPLLDEETDGRSMTTVAASALNHRRRRATQSPLTHLVRWSLSKAFVIQPKLDLYLHAPLFKLQSSMIHISIYIHDELLLLFAVKKKRLYFFSLLLSHTIKSGCLQSVSDQRWRDSS